MSFYDIFVSECQKKGVRPSRAAEDCGINRSNVSNWKNNGYTPRGDALQRIADYFGVSADYLLTGDEKEKATIDIVDDDLKEYLDELRNRPEMRMLFSTTKSATKEQIEAIVKFIEELRN